ncbi:MULTISPECIES: type III secretion system inner rod subunit SctI [unclassified Paludibacterium]|uniref:type III secretion system inner rod subunit SctI n=1 Tax=unclassified Paludibacterium TaxID=2618429 RepID=UPI00207B262A|nr:type III secretion system inner rod subunit SctI [Paludibacterium sp. B53371]BEV73185.1 hypothetical protein THUN1379_26670 [Paludibacterium sp. THUN1379]
MTIEPLAGARPLSALDRPLPPPPSAQAVDRFAALLSAEAPGSPEGMLQAQGALTQLTLGSDLTAKVAGALTQAINKLVNLQ